jgi:hypothetical protein
MGEEIWVVSARGAYAAVIVASSEAKPGVLLDRMEAELASADVARASEGPEGERNEPGKRPRSSLHPEPRLEVKPERVKAHAGATSKAVVDLSASEPTKLEPPKRPAKPKRGPGKAEEVDRIALAREFGRLIDDQAEGY